MGDADEVLAANQRFYAAFRARDAFAMHDVWAREAPVACIHPGWGPLIGREEVMRVWRDILENPDAPQVECTDPEVTLLGEVAHVICVEHVELPSQGAAGVFVATNLFAREDGAWRLVHHQSSPLSEDDDETAPTLLN